MTHKPTTRTGLLKTTLAFSTLASLVLLLTFAGSPAAAQETTIGDQTEPLQQAPDPPEIDAEAWALVAAPPGVYLAGENPDEQLPIASTTKIMAALVVLESGVDLQREVTVPSEAEEFVGFTYSNVGLIAGERITIRDLLVASLVPSGTDAVYTLAYVLGDDVDNFVEDMNELASSMELENTRFASPAGLDSPENYSSARDLAKLARAAMEYPAFAEITRLTEPTINTDSREIQLVTTNSLLYYYPEATGIKTGTSPEAGPSLVASAEADGESYIAVVLGADEDQYRFVAAETLLSYAFEDYEREPLVDEGEELEELEVPFRPDESVALVAEREVLGTSGPGLEVENRVNTPELPDAAEAGQRLGTVETFVNGRSVGRSPLVAESGYEEASFWTKSWYRIRSLFE